MTVLRLTELLERGERLPQPERCPSEVRSSLCSSPPWDQGESEQPGEASLPDSLCLTATPRPHPSEPTFLDLFRLDCYNKLFPFPRSIASWRTAGRQRPHSARPSRTSYPSSDHTTRNTKARPPRCSVSAEAHQQLCLRGLEQTVPTESNSWSLT